VNFLGFMACFGDRQTSLYDLILGERGAGDKVLFWRLSSVL
jgi:hypothetical protein